MFKWAGEKWLMRCKEINRETIKADEYEIAMNISNLTSGLKL